MNIYDTMNQLEREFRALPEYQAELLQHLLRLRLMKLLVLCMRNLSISKRKCKWVKF